MCLALKLISANTAHYEITSHYKINIILRIVINLLCNFRDIKNFFTTHNFASRRCTKIAMNFAEGVIQNDETVATVC